MDLLSRNELSMACREFNLEEFLEERPENDSRCAVGVITDKQIVLMETLDDGSGLHDEAIGNIYYEMYSSVKNKVDNLNIDVYNVREDIIKNRDITMRFVNSNGGLLQIYIPEFLTQNMYELFKDFLDSNHYLFINLEHYCIFLNDFVYEYDKIKKLFVNMMDKRDSYDIDKLFQYLNTLIRESKNLEYEYSIGTMLENRKL